MNASENALRDTMASWLQMPAKLLRIAGLVSPHVRRLRRQLAEARAKAADAEQRALEASDRLRAAIEVLPEGIVFLDSDHRYVMWNAAYAEIYKGSADLFKAGVRLDDTLRVGVARGEYPEAIGREDAWIKERLARLDQPGERHEQRLADGRWILIQERRTDDGGIIGMRVDITEMKKREASFRLLFDSNPVPMLVYDAATQRIHAANDAAIELYGHSRAELLSLTLGDLAADGESRDPARVGHDLRLKSRTCHHRRADGSLIDVTLFAQALTHEGRPAIIVAAVDITEQKRAQARIAHMARHDALTGLANRVLFQDRISDALEKVEDRGGSFAVLLVDLDRFKAINDTLGHSAGDRLLELAAERIRAAAGEDDLVARLGGDEFAVLVGNAHPTAIADLAERLGTAISAPYDIEGNAAIIGASIGVAVAPADGADPDKIVRSADLALYRAKADGRGGVRFFEPGMDAEVQARRLLERDLRQAIATGGLEVHYQPLIALATGKPTGVEALVRWTHPTRGPVSPAEFIPVAEETGLVSEIGRFVLERACRDAATWPDDIKVAVNLSPIQFRHDSVLAMVMRALAAANLPPHRLELEITETLMMDRNEATLATLHALRALGVGISMDDFGTGYSSLNYLRSFPFTKIKIDRVFVKEVSRNRDSMAIVRAIVALGASLGMTVTAEGIEDLADLGYLRTEGCVEGQGWVFSAARPAREVEKLFERSTPAKAVA